MIQIIMWRESHHQAKCSKKEAYEAVIKINNLTNETFTYEYCTLCERSTTGAVINQRSVNIGLALYIWDTI